MDGKAITAFFDTKSSRSKGQNKPEAQDVMPRVHKPTSLDEAVQPAESVSKGCDYKWKP